jgi:serine/threonine protein kinase
VYGRVYITTEKQTSMQFAAKRVIRRTLHPSDVQAVNDEIDVLRAVAGCDQIIKLHTVYEDADITTIVMEHFGGQPLIDRLIENKKLTEYYAKEVVRNLMVGVAYCHKKRIANRNLKLDNILLVSSLNLVYVVLPCQPVSSTCILYSSPRIPKPVAT